MAHSIEVVSQVCNLKLALTPKPSAVLPKRFLPILEMNSLKLLFNSLMYKCTTTNGE
jgi:hypothetical protein